VRLVGTDFDINYLVLPGLSVYANGGYTHSAINTYEVNPAVRGNRAPLVPEFNANLGVQYRHPITGSIGGFGRFGVEAHGAEYWDPENSTGRSPYDLLNLQLGVETLSRSLSLVFFVNNLADKAYNANYVSGGFTIPAEPRTFGATLRFDL
ncbi:MAG TPA: TonB-dependent receptor, partial [Steroidobacteraceae bacterium]